MSNVVKRVNDDRLDELELAMVQQLDIVDCPLIHLFTPKLYIRQIFMDKDLLITSKIHNTEHPFTVSMGKVLVSIDGKEWEKIEAPYTGITRVGTRRVLYIIEPTIWTTYHPLDFIDGSENELDEIDKSLLISKIEDTILEKHENKLLVNSKKIEICHL